MELVRGGEMIPGAIIHGVFETDSGFRVGWHIAVRV